MPSCAFCETPINPDTDFRKVTGYEKHRNAGGTNALALREPTDEWACRWCVEKLKRGITADQQSLL